MKVLAEKIEAVVFASDSVKLQMLVAEIDDRLLEMYDEVFPDFLLKKIIYVSKLDRFGLLPDSWFLLNLVKDNIGLLTIEQRTLFAQTLESIYESFREFMGCFVSVEMIVELLIDRRALDIIKRLKNVKREIPRSMVPHGFEWFIKETIDPELKQAAFSELNSMKNDSSPVVRQEVEESLNWLRRRS